MKNKNVIVCYKAVFDSGEPYEDQMLIQSVADHDEAAYNFWIDIIHNLTLSQLTSIEITRFIDN